MLLWHARAQGLREVCTADGALLCFDEVMTGFRIAKGCAQAHFGIMPDLTTARALPCACPPALCSHARRPEEIHAACGFEPSARALCEASPAWPATPRTRRCAFWFAVE